MKRDKKQARLWKYGARKVNIFWASGIRFLACVPASGSSLHDTGESGMFQKAFGNPLNLCVAEMGTA